MLADIGLVVGRVLTFFAVLAGPGAVASLCWLGLSFIGAGAFVIWSTRSKSASDDLGFASAAGLAAGFVLTAHMALENFGAHIGEDWRLTLAAMAAAFMLWLISGWWAARRDMSVLAGAVAGCWTAVLSVIAAVTFGFVGMYFNLPSAEYVATWPEYQQGGWRDPQAFAIINTLDAGTSHIVTALLFGTALGAAGGLILLLQKRRPRLMTGQQ